MDLLIEVCPPWARKTSSWLNCLIGLAFSIILIYAGTVEVQHMAYIGMRTDSNLDLPLWFVRLAIPIGGTLFAMHFIGSIYALKCGIDPNSKIITSGTRMLTVIALITLLVFVAAGIHIAIALGVVATLMLSFNLDIPIIMIAQMAWGSIDSYALVAIPFFILAGNLMTRGNLALILLELMGSVLRCFRGGIVLTLSLSSVFFSAVIGGVRCCYGACGGRSAAA
jgi:hypothetical protein